MELPIFKIKLKVITQQLLVISLMESGVYLMIIGFQKNLKTKFVNRIVLTCSFINVDVLFLGSPKLFQIKLLKNIKE